LSAEGGEVFRCTCPDGEVYPVGIDSSSKLALCDNGKRGKSLPYEQNKKYERQGVSCVIPDLTYRIVGERVRAYVMERAPQHATMIKDSFQVMDVEFGDLTYFEKYRFYLLRPKLMHTMIKAILNILRKPRMESAEKKFLIKYDLIYYMNVKSLEKIDLVEKLYKY
jgi:hypothetical protein